MSLTLKSLSTAWHLSFLFLSPKLSPPTLAYQGLPFSQWVCETPVPSIHYAESNLQTESAREARKSFYCELCSKGYSRMNEFEAHEGSYDHLHKKVGGFLIVFLRIDRGQ